jgi:hypothetical protein
MRCFRSPEQVARLLLTVDAIRPLRGEEGGGLRGSGALYRGHDHAAVHILKHHIQPLGVFRLLDNLSAIVTIDRTTL